MANLSHVCCASSLSMDMNLLLIPISLILCPTPPPFLNRFASWCTFSSYIIIIYYCGSTMQEGCSQWQTVAQTQTEASSSLPMPNNLISMDYTPSLAKSFMASKCLTSWKRSKSSFPSHHLVCSFLLCDRVLKRMILNPVAGLVLSLFILMILGDVIVQTQTGPGDRPLAEIRLNRVTIHANPLAG